MWLFKDLIITFNTPFTTLSFIMHSCIPPSKDKSMPATRLSTGNTTWAKQMVSWGSLMAYLVGICSVGPEPPPHPLAGCTTLESPPLVLASLVFFAKCLPSVCTLFQEESLDIECSSIKFYGRLLSLWWASSHGTRWVILRLIASLICMFFVISF